MRYRKNSYRVKFKKCQNNKRDIARIYELEKARYSNMHELDIEIEKLNLKSNLDNYKNNMFMHYLCILVVTTTCFAAVALLVIINFGSILALVLTSLLLVDMFVIIMYFNKNIVQKEIRQNLYYEISMSILKDLAEKESIRRYDHQSLRQ